MSTNPVYHDPSTGVTRARRFLIAAGFVIATSAVVYSATGSETVQKAMHAFGLDRDAPIAAAQRQQALAIGRLEDRLGLVLRDIDGLSSHPVRAATNPASEDRLTRIDSELARLRAENSKLLDAQSDTSEELGHIRAVLANADIGIAQLRVSIDAGETRQRNAVAAINERLDRRDVTGSIHTSKARRPSRRTVTN